jgi:hypothetical protein
VAAEEKGGEGCTLRKKVMFVNKRPRRRRTAVRRTAEEALLDRTVILVSPEAYRKFLARLNAPPKPNPRLRTSMSTIPPWR